MPEDYVLKLRHTGSPNRGGGEGALIGEGVSFTLSTNQDQTLFHSDGGRYIVRRITPLECERLQGFPDGWTAIPYCGKPCAPDTPRYKAMGNSMAVPVIRWIGERIQMVDSIDKVVHMSKQELGTQLMVHRRRAGLTQAEAADIANVSVGTVGNWERGVVDIPFTKACIIADALGITLEELAGR